MKNNILIAFFLTVAQFVSAQVSDVSYKLKYNAESCAYDCYLVVNSGVAKSIRERVQFNSQVTLIAPDDALVTITESFMPLVDNQKMRSAIPTSWDVTNIVDNPADLPNSKVMAISPSITPSSFYNELRAGDEVKLFTVSVTPMPVCGEGVRLFQNGIDPDSAAKGMDRADFSNAFTIGGVQDKLSGTISEGPIAPSITEVVMTPHDRNNVNVKVDANLGSVCQAGLQYSFSAPNGKTIGTLKDFSALTSYVDGAYKVVVTDALGCKDEAEFYPLGNKTSETDVVGMTPRSNDDVAFTSSIYPNPAQDVVNLTLSGAQGSVVNIQITDISGNTVLKSFDEVVLGSQTKDVKLPTGLTPGIYNLTLTIDQKENVSHKLLIIK